MSKPSEIQKAYNTLIDCINDMAKDAGGLRVTDMAAIKGMTDAVINLKKELAEKKQELSDLKASLPKIKADAFKDGVERARDVVEDVDADIEWGYDGDFGSFHEINSRLDKLEAGE